MLKVPGRCVRRPPAIDNLVRELRKTRPDPDALVTLKRKAQQAAGSELVLAEMLDDELWGRLQRNLPVYISYMDDTDEKPGH